MTQSVTADAMLANAWRATPAATAARWSHGLWWRAPHLVYLSNALANMASGVPLRLLVSMPPRMGKSEAVSHWLPVWLLANWPSKRIILASYEANFAASWGRKVRDTIEEHGRELGVRLRGDTKAVDAWDTTAGGGMVTAGVGGPITGRGADLLIIDDPIKNAEEAASPVIRDKIWEWWQTTARTRLEPGGSVVVVMTRWDVDDLAGRLLVTKDEVWRNIVFPALAERPGDVLDRREGDALWPERYSLVALRALRSDVGEDAWASLYQQRPNPQGRGLFFDIESAQQLLGLCQVPLTTRLGGAVSIWAPPVRGARYIAGGDCAWGEKGAYSVFSIEDFQTGQQAAEVYGRLPLDELADLNVKLAREYNDAYAGIERNGEGEKVARMMVSLGYGGRMYWHDRDRDMPGWLTGSQSGAGNRQVMLADLEQAVREKAIRPMCREGCGELLSFVRDEKGKPVPRQGTYSDHIMAWAIGRQMRNHARFGMLSNNGAPVYLPRRW